MSTQAALLADSTFTFALSADTVVVALPGAVTGSGTAIGAQIPLSALAAYIGTVDGPFVMTTATTTPSAFTDTTFEGFSSATLGAALMGSGSTYDAALLNRAGTVALGVTANTTGIVLPGALAVQGATLTLSTAGAAFALTGTTTALTADVASGAITVKANVGTGSGAVGGFVFQVPVTHGSDSVAQTLTTVLTLSATTTVSAVFAGSLKSVGGFGCNNATPQTAATIGAALAAYSTGAFGLDSDANMHALYDDVVAIRAALVANGILTV